MKLLAEYRNFRKYAKTYTYYFYRRNLDTGLALPLCLVIGCARLAYFMMSEWLARARSRAPGQHALLVLVGTQNNRKAYGLIQKHLPPHDLATFHTDAGTGRRINLLHAYRTGLSSLRVVPALVWRRARYARLVCKNLDVFVLANGRLSERERAFVASYPGVISFSEYSVYSNLILASRDPRARLIYFPHAQLPRRHHPFLASDVFIDAATQGNFASEAERFHPVEGLYEAISRGSASVDAGTRETPAGKRVLICTNTLDSPWRIAALVRRLRRGAAGQAEVLVRMHPAEKFTSLKARLYAHAGARIDRSPTCAEALRGTGFVYGGFTGALIEAMRGGARVYSSVPAARLAAYFDVPELSAAGDEPTLLADIVRGPAPKIDEAAAPRDAMRAAQDTDRELQRIFAGIFGTNEA